MSQAPAPALPSRRARKKERTRREIYEAAMGLFTAHGFDGVTIDQICDAADVARATFFLHFPSKAALLSEFNRALAGEVRERLREPRDDAVAEFRTMATVLSERWLEHAEVVGDMLRQLLVSREALGATEAGSRDLRHLIEEIVQRGQERGEFRREVDPRLAAALFLSTSCALLSGSVYEPGERRPQEIRQQFLDALFQGLLEANPSPTA